MKKRILIVCLAVLVLSVGLWTYFCLTWRSRTEAKGNRIVARIEAYKSRYGAYPDNLGVLGIPAKGDGNALGGVTFFYDRWQDGTYSLYFTAGPDETYVYDSLLKTWLDGFSYVSDREKRQTIFEHIQACYTNGWIDSTVVDSVKPNVLRLQPEGHATVPDSLAYIRNYYKDGNLAGLGWITFFKDPEDNGASRIGLWTFYTEGGTSVTVDYRHGTSTPLYVRK